MNRKQRTEISDMVATLRGMCDNITAIEADEQEKYDNLPPGLQEGEQGTEIEDGMENLCDARFSIESAIESLGAIAV